jgi:hypothetical protein
MSLRCGCLVAALTCVGEAAAEELVLRSRGLEGSTLVVEVVARDLEQVGSFDIDVAFDPDALRAPQREDGGLIQGTMVADHTPEAGRYRLGVVAPAGVSGEGAIATLRFPLRGGGETELDLQARLTDLDGYPRDASARGLRVALANGAMVEHGSAPGEPGDDGLGQTKADVVEQGDAASDPLPPPEGELARMTPDTGAGEPAPDDASSTQVDRQRVRRIGDFLARKAGYSMYVRFVPEEKLAEEGTTVMRLRVQVLRHGQPRALEPEDVTIDGPGFEVVQAESTQDPLGLGIELAVAADDLPASVELTAFGLFETHEVPVYPRADIDFDGSGAITEADHRLLARSYGARRGLHGYEERFDIVRDDVLDERDLKAFRANTIEFERARRLELLSRESAEER